MNIYVNDRDPDLEEVVTYTGLSVMVRGYLVHLRCDELHKVASVRVNALAGYEPTGLYQADVSASAKMLASRARRFLGPTWTVVEWIPMTVVAIGA